MNRGIISIIRSGSFGRDVMASYNGWCNAVPFIREHRLWQGILGYSWVSKAMIFAGIVTGVLLFSFVFNYWSKPEVLSTQSLGGWLSAVSAFFSEGYKFIVLGFFKYVVLVLMEIFIFHFTRESLEITTQVDQDTSMKAFFRAEKRMIKVVIFSFLYESIATLIIKFSCGILPIGFMETVFIAIIHSFFVGYAIVDNFNETFGLSIKQSFYFTLQYLGVALTIGFVVYFAMFIPLIGTFAGPLIGAVAATLTMHKLHTNDQNMQWAFDISRKDT